MYKLEITNNRDNSDLSFKAHNHNNLNILSKNIYFNVINFFLYNLQTISMFEHDDKHFLVLYKQNNLAKS